MRGQDALPVLCKTCGGSVEPQPDLSLACQYCGTHDRLPKDDLARTLELKRRIAAVARGAQQLEGLNAVLAPMFETRGTFSILAGTGLVVAFLTAALIVSLAVAGGGPPAAMLGRGLLYGAYANAPVGLLLGLSLSLLFGRHVYRRRVRDQLLARPRRDPGAPLRCRVCGADLAEGDDAFIRCDYCGSRSLAKEDERLNRVERLQREEESYRGQASRVTGHVARAGLQMDRILAISVVLTYVITYGSLVLSQALLP